MKIFSLFIIGLSFIILQSGGCSEEEKILKQELTDEQIAILSKQPECLKTLVANSYRNEGDLTNMQLVKSTVYGEVLYKLEMGEYKAMLTDGCNRVNKPIDGKEFVKNNEFLIGKEGRAFYDKFRGKDDAEVTISEKEKISLTTCINEKINFFINDKASLSTSSIYRYVSEGTVYFLFDEGMAVDGPGYILSESCDTVCVTGGMRRGMVERPKCPQADSGTQKLIWEKEKGFNIK